MSKIIDIKARQILASGGLPTVEADVYLKSGVVGVASVPYGVSDGSKEAVVLIDGDETRYGGKGVTKAVNSVTGLIKDGLVGMEAKNQRQIDEKMVMLDGTSDKSYLGGNAILAVSLAVARAMALEAKKPLYKYLRDCFEIDLKDWVLPKPMAVMIEGGKHADKSTDLQEYLLTVTNEDIKVTETVRMMSEVYLKLGEILKQEGFTINVGHEGAFAPAGINSNKLPLEYILRAIEKAGYRTGEDAKLSLDAAASEFWDEDKKRYMLKLENKELSSGQMIDYFMAWAEEYPIVTMEDLLAENDWKAWVILTDRLNKLNIVNIGDDLTVSSAQILQKTLAEKAASGVLVKLNQTGSLSETVDCLKMAMEHEIPAVPSHRGGGETNDTFMVDLAVAFNCPWIKVGPSRGERVCKYNRLMKIEEELA